MWAERRHWAVPVYPFLQRKQFMYFGCDTGQDVYIVQSEQETIYVGKTITGVWNRLWQHARTGSKLGKWLVEHEFDFASTSFQLEVIGVDGNIDEAEQHTISARAPILNTVMYKNALALPPARVCEPEIIDVYNLQFLHSIFNPPSSGYIEATPAYLSGRTGYVINELYTHTYHDTRLQVEYANSATKDVFYYRRIRRLRSE